MYDALNKAPYRPTLKTLKSYQTILKTPDFSTSLLTSSSLLAINNEEDVAIGYPFLMTLCALSEFNNTDDIDQFIELLKEKLNKTDPDQKERFINQTHKKETALDVLDARNEAIKKAKPLESAYLALLKYDLTKLGAKKYHQLTFKSRPRKSPTRKRETSDIEANAPLDAAGAKLSQSVPITRQRTRQVQSSIESSDSKFEVSNSSS